MIIALSILALFAIVAATGAASRVQRQIASQTQAAPAASDRSFQPSASSLQETESPEALKPQIDDDREFEPSYSTSKPPSKPDESSGSQQSADSYFTPVPEASAAELVQLSVDQQPDIPLAASLTVTEVVNPLEVEPTVALQSSDSGIQAAPSSEDSLEQHPAHHNLLQEIAQLEPGHQNQIDHLARYIRHSDNVTRAAAAFALGELGAKTQGKELEQIVSILNQFNEDANPQVRLQAVTALGKAQLR